MDLQLTQGPILIVGGSGLLGHHLTLALVKGRSVPAERIHVLDLRLPDTQSTVQGVGYHAGDASKLEDVKKTLSLVEPLVVFHLASSRPFEASLDRYLEVNVGGTKNLLEAAQHVKTVRAFVYTSSSSIIHDAVSDLKNGNETWPILYMPQQPEPYHHSKALAEKLVLEANRKQDLFTAALRPSGLFGAGDQQTTLAMFNNAKQGRLRNQIGDNTNLVDWTYIENAAEAHILAAEALLRAAADSTPAPASSRVEGEAFFITNGEPIPFWDFAWKIAAAANVPVDRKQVRKIPKSIALLAATLVEWGVWLASFGRRKIVVRQRLVYSTIWRTFDISKARTRLGYNPSISLDEGIRRSVIPLLEQDKKQL